MEQNEGKSFRIVNIKGFKMYRDKLHGITAFCKNKTMAWQLIRNDCHERGLEVPTMDMIIDIVEDDETDSISAAEQGYTTPIDKAGRRKDEN